MDKFKPGDRVTIIPAYAGAVVSTGRIIQRAKDDFKGVPVYSVKKDFSGSEFYFIETILDLIPPDHLNWGNDQTGWRTLD